MVLQHELFSLFFHIWWIFASHTFWEGGRESDRGREGGKERGELDYKCISWKRKTFDAQPCQPSLLPSGLILRWLCPSPCSPDKKDPLLRCFARHYKTVAMDTHSEQAPHPGSRVGNDRCNISFFFFFKERNCRFFSSISSSKADVALCYRCQRSRLVNRSVRLMAAVVSAAAF